MSVVAYRLEVDGVLIRRLVDGEIQFTLDNLSPLTEYNIQVFAEDAVGQVSNPLVRSVTTSDLANPEWPASAELRALSIMPYSVQLIWTPSG